MAVLSTSSDVQFSANGTAGVHGNGTTGEAISKYDFCYKDSASSNVLMQAINTSQAAANGKFFAPVAADSGNILFYVEIGNGTVLEFDAGDLVAGTAYVISSTAGKIEPIGDTSTGDYLHYIGTAYNTQHLVCNPHFIGIKA